MLAVILVGLMCQSLVFGAYQVMFMGSMYFFMYGRRSEGINRLFLTVALVMWTLILVHYCLALSIAMDGFTGLLPVFKEYPDAFVAHFTSVNSWKQVARTGVYITLTAVSDSLLVYRLFIVWARNRRMIALPVLMLSGSIASGIVIEVISSTTTSGLFFPRLALCAAVFFMSSLILNIAATCMIVYKIWRVHITIPFENGGRSLRPVIGIMLESGAIYSTTLLILLATYLAKSDASFIAFDMLVPIIGITFSMIIVRAGLGSSVVNRDLNPPSTIVMTEFPRTDQSVRVSQPVTIEHNDSDSMGRAAETTTRELVVWRQSGEAVR